MQIILHCGHFKTGTTAFQSELARRRSRLLAAGVFVPGAPKGNHGYLLNPRRAERLRSLSGALREELHRAQSAGARYAVMSAEVMAHLNENQLEMVRSVLQPWPVLPVLVLRPWATALPSRYTQNVVSGDWQSLPAWLGSLAIAGQRHPDADFSLVVHRLRRVFGAVWVAPYGQDAALEMLSTLIPDVRRLDRMGDRAPVENRSMPWQRREMLRFVNAVVGASLGRRHDAKNAQAAGCSEEFFPLLLRPWLESAIAEAHPWTVALHECVGTVQRECSWGEMGAFIQQWNVSLQAEFAEPAVRVCGAQLAWTRFAEAPLASASWSDFSAVETQGLASAVLMHWQKAQRP